MKCFEIINGTIFFFLKYSGLLKRKKKRMFIKYRFKRKCATGERPLDEKSSNPENITRISREGAGGGDRTHTPLRVLDFESSASASSATPASLATVSHRIGCAQVQITGDLGGTRADGLHW